MLEEIKKLNLNSVKFFPAVIHEIPIVGCTISHIECIRLAKERNLEYVLILEDDVEFISNVTDVLNNSWKSLQELDWNILYLGGLIRDSGSYVNKNLISVLKVNTTHTYIVHNRFYDTILNLDENIPIDYSYRALSYKHKMYMTAPITAYQKEDYSDIQNRVVNYKGEMNKAFNAIK
jgi:GR25 family glycosyltransferase involved in LPS biosynthesis